MLSYITKIEIKTNLFFLYSKEIEEKIQNKDLTNSLKNLDKAIYGNMIDEATKQSLVFLQQYAQNAYQLKIEEVRNA